MIARAFTSLVIAGGIVLSVVLFAWGWDSREARQDRANLEAMVSRQVAEIELAGLQSQASLRQMVAEREAQLRIERMETLYPLGTMAQGALYLTLPLLLAWVVLVLYDGYWQRHIPLVLPTSGGMLPVSRRAIEEGGLRYLTTIQEERNETERIRAISQRPGVPAHYAPTITYSPHHSSKNDYQGGVDSPFPVPPFPVPSFSDLLRGGQVGMGQPFILGYTEEGPITGGWKDLYSAAVAGVSGSGKTTTQRYLTLLTCLQGGAQGARLIIVDPHADAGEESLAGTLAPLHRSFMCQPAQDERGIVASLRLAERELQRRLDGGDSSWPLLVLVDEFTYLMRTQEVAGLLPSLLERVAQEGRKRNVFAMVSGQIWKTTRTGGSELRDSFASAYVHRIKRNQARMLLQTSGNELPNTSDLPTGTALLYRTNGELVTVRIPNTTNEDVLRVAEILDGATSRPSVPVPPEVIIEPMEAADGVTWNTETEVDSLRVATIRQMLKGGATITQVTKEVWGVDGGRGYQKAAEELRQIIARMI